MPFIKRSGSFRYTIQDNDHNPPHIHVRDRRHEARITVDGIVLSNTGFKSRNLKVMIAFIERYREDFEEAWNELRPKRD